MRFWLPAAAIPCTDSGDAPFIGNALGNILITIFWSNSISGYNREYEKYSIFLYPWTHLRQQKKDTFRCPSLYNL
jgi:hypothetical protein